jgi:hypothetical protein
MTLLSRWKLNDASGPVATDSVGANSGEYLGSPLLGQAPIVPAYWDKCPQFDGVNDFIDLGKIIENWAACTQKFWIKPAAKAFHQLSDFGAAPGVWLTESGEVKAEVDPSETTAAVLGAAAAYSAGQVLCIHCTYASGRFRLYINGVKVKESTTPKGTITNGAANGGTLGANGARSGGFLNGQMARVELWDSEMSEAEIAADYLVDSTERGPEPEEAQAVPPVPTKQQPLRVVAYDPPAAASGWVPAQGWELSDRVSGLSYSNKNPGGDYICTFSLHTSWLLRNREIDKGNLIRVMDGINVLWQGRIQDTVRGQSGKDPTINVTAYGLGVRLKDTTFAEIWIDRSLEWNEPSLQRKINILAAGREYSRTSIEESPSGSSTPGFLIHIDSWLETPHPTAEHWYYGGGVDIGKLMYDFIVPKPAGTESLATGMAIENDDLGSIALAASPNHRNTPASAQLLTASGAGGKYAFFYLVWEGGGTGTNGGDTWGFQNIAVIGRHGIALSGSWPSVGLLAYKVIENLIGRATGIQLRAQARTTYVIQQLAQKEPTTIEDGIVKANEFDSSTRTWGTWGPNGALLSQVASWEGYFDYVEIKNSPSWYCFREECEDIDLSTEMSSLYDRVEVKYTPNDGVQRYVVRTTVVRDLVEAGMSPRTFALDAGQATAEDAAALGDAFLALSGGFAPARGSVAIAQPQIRHATKGRIPSHWMRADGSAIRLIDVLPNYQAMGLSSTPERRSTFPIKEVVVDASDRAQPRTTVTVDQSREDMSVLQARLSLDTARIGL